MKNSLSGYTTRMTRRILQFFFKFDKWHISSLDQRKYAVDIISYCNTRNKKDFFAEIGCGLGDIIRNVDFKIKKGYDIDNKVLKAAKFISSLKNKRNIIYEVFNFPDTPLNGTFDMIILVNWIHHIEPAVLKNKLSEYFSNNLSVSGEIIIDTVQDKAYRYNHQVTYLIEDLNCSLISIGKYAREREVWVIKKIK